jgi:hypothetical protein
LRKNTDQKKKEVCRCTSFGGKQQQAVLFWWEKWSDYFFLEGNGATASFWREPSKEKKNFPPN